MLGRLQRGHFYSACNPITLCVCILLWAGRGCAALYFYAYDYSSWVSTVMVFRNTSISRDTGWLQLNPYTNATVGRALYKTTFQMRNSTNGSLSSFNTSFVFAMSTDRRKEYFGDGLAFLICPNPFRGEDLQVSSGGYLGMFNSSTNGLDKNKVFAIEFDTHQNAAFKDPNDNHIGVDVNSVVSLKTNNLSTLGIILNEGKRIICWVDYDGGRRHLWVYLALSPSGKPSKPAIAMALDLAPYMKDNMYVGFTSATGTRAELHTIFSWWFLAGFGKLTMPVSPSPPSSHRPLASLGQRSIVIAIFLLVVVVGFLGSFCIYARRRWLKQSKHLIDILLPVACWMYWKESITCEVRSARCLKLATPTVELLAWLWRTRLAKKHDRPQVKTWLEMLLKRKMGPHYSGEAWQLEEKRRKRRKTNGAVHVMIYEEAIDEESPVYEDDMRGRVVVIKHIRMRPVPERKVEEAAAVERKEQPVVVPPPPVIKQQREAKLEGKDRPPLKTEGLARSILKAGAKGKDKDPKHYIIGSNSFVLVEEESDAQLFQRRGSFLIPQGARDDGHELPLEHATVPVVAAPWARPRPEAAGPSKVKIAKGHMRLQPETLLISTDDPTSDAQIFQRRGSFLIPQDAPDDGRELPLEPAKEVHATVPVVAAPQVRPQPEAAGPSKVKIAKGPTRLQPETQLSSTDDPPSDKFYMRRGSFSVHPEDASNVAGAWSLEEGRKEPLLHYLVEQGIDDIKFERGVDVRRGSFSVHTEAAMKLTGSQSVEGGKEPLMQYLIEQDITSNSKRRIDVRRGSFIVVEDSGSSSVSSADDGGKSHVTHPWLFD